MFDRNDFLVKKYLIWIFKDLKELIVFVLKDLWFDMILSVDLLIRFKYLKVVVLYYFCWLVMGIGCFCVLFLEVSILCIFLMFDKYILDMVGWVIRLGKSNW